MPRFVILEHDHPALHWDLMLEAGEVLRTWRLTAFPSPGIAIDVERITDHRLHYLDYEGPVSGGRGTVRRRESGTYADFEQSEQITQFRLEGIHVRGRCTIVSKPDGTGELTFTGEGT